MLKLLLGHWQAHREPLPFVLTDDPLYCSHLTKSPFPEVYSVNRVNPIFEDDEADPPLKRSISDEYRRSSDDAGYSSGGHQNRSVTNRVTPILEEEELPLKRSISCDSRYSPKKSLNGTGHWNSSPQKSVPEFYSVKRVHSNENAIPLQRSISEKARRSLKGSRFSEDTTYASSDPLKSVNYIFQEIENNPLPLKRSISDESRYSPRSSDDTGYSSSGHLKSAGSLTTTSEDAASLRHMSSDSDDCSQPEAVVVSVDVHRVSNPEDVIVLTSSALSSPSQTFSASSSRCSDPYDSLTMSSSGADAANKKPNLVVREKLQRLLEKGTSNEAFLDSLEAKPPSPEDIEKTKNDLMKSLTRALNGKVPNKMESNGAEMVTRTDDSAPDASQKSLDRKSISSSTSPKALYFSQPSLANGVTRQDESSASSGSISFVKHKRPRNAKHPAEKEAKRGSAESSQESSDSKKSQKCKLCENAKRPLAFHQLLPGHWSYDNVYLPHISGMCCSCVHHSPSFPPSSDDDVFYPMYFPQDMARVRHSWANPISRDLLTDKSPKRKRSTEDKTTSSNSNKDKHSPRYSPDGSSRETSDSSTNSNQLKKSLVERRSLREPKKCKCEHCLASVLDKNRSHLGGHTCPCHSLSDRRVKFASDTDVSHHKHMHSIPINLGKEGSKLVNGEPINAAFVMNLPYLNGHALSNSQETKDGGLKSKKAPPLVPRGLKEPIKVDYRAYPVNFRDWEAHYRRSYLKERRRRALNMVGMAIGIVMVVGIAVTLTFVFLRMRRPA